MARASALALAAAALAAGAAIALTGAPPPPPPDSSAAEEGVRAELDGRLRELAAGLKARAGTLAELPRLQLAVATDANTVHDLTQEELAFRPRAGETIEIGQVAGSGAVTSLWRSATDPAPRPALEREGLSLQVVDGALHLSAVAAVQPRARVEELRGAIAVSWRVDLASVAARAQAAGFAAWLEVGGARVEVHRQPSATGPARGLPLASEAGLGATLRLQLPPAQRPERLAGPRPLIGLGVALAGLLVAVLLGRRGPAAAVGEPGALAASGPDSRAATGAASLVRGAPSRVGGDGPESSMEARETRVNPGSNLALAATAVHQSDPGAAVAASLGPAPAAARVVGRYRVERLLGSGGMADVYLARAQGEAGFERKVALKVLHPAMARQPQIVDHFLDEARLASRLTHPNIVQIADLGRAGDDYFIAMEYVEGSDLEKLLFSARAGGRPVPLKVGLHIVRRILDGLEAAHTATGDDGKPLELVHRDVKSANVFIAAQGAVKIGDFGIAKANQQLRVARTEVGQVKGTAAYMAPEHRIGEEVDARADQYSAAAIAYEVLTGEEINLDLARIAHKGREGWPHLAPIRTVRPDVPAELDAAIFRALSYAREDRYPSCAAFEEALEAIATRYGLLATDKAVAAWMASEQAAGASPPAA